MASRQSRAGQLIQPADPWICTQNSKSHSSCGGRNASLFLGTSLWLDNVGMESAFPVVDAVNYFDPGFVVGMPGGGVYDHRVVSHLQNIIILSPESGSAPSNWPRSRSMGLRAQGIKL